MSIRSAPAAPPPRRWVITALLHVYSTRRTRLLRDLRQRAAWADEARNAPPLRFWVEAADATALGAPSSIGLRPTNS
jgi:hypothetical protein